MTTYTTDASTLPATCSPHCNPVSHDIECRTPMPQWTPSKTRAEADWPGVGILRPRVDEDGEVDPALSDWRAAEVYGA